MTRDVYIVGEDAVTRAIIYRLIKDYATGLRVVQSLPARGGEIKSKIDAFNKLASYYPVILLGDLDAEPCPPIAKAKLFETVRTVSKDFIVNIAVDEAEAWLFADREGFASYFEVPLEYLPKSALQKFQGLKPIREMFVSVKPSYYLTHCLIKKSSNSILREKLFSSSSCKGKEYNSTILPFINDYWSPEVARINSYSLDRMIHRIQSVSLGLE